eukprot:4902797-Prymnesium_polylepis.1
MIYQSCRMHHDAVQLALQHGRIDLAKRSAEMVVAQPLRRVLWLKIIRYFVACCDDLCAVGDVLDLMEESRLQKEQPLLQLEDLLSVLPEFMLIDDVQRPVCTALTGYADRMEELRNEIDEAACAAAKLRDDVQRLERRQISALHRCCDCKEIMPLDVLSCCAQQLKCVQHVAFPCHHAFCIKCIGTSKAQAQSVEVCRIRCRGWSLHGDDTRIVRLRIRCPNAFSVASAWWIRFLSLSLARWRAMCSRGGKSTHHSDPLLGCLQKGKYRGALRFDGWALQSWVTYSVTQ